MMAFKGPGVGLTAGDGKRIRLLPSGYSKKILLLKGELKETFSSPSVPLR